MSAEKVERNQDIMERVERGDTYEQIAAYYNITKQRVGQIVEMMRKRQQDG